MHRFEAWLFWVFSRAWVLWALIAAMFLGFLGLLHDGMREKDEVARAAARAYAREQQLPLASVRCTKPGPVEATTYCTAGTHTMLCDTLQGEGRGPARCVRLR